VSRVFLIYKILNGTFIYKFIAPVQAAVAEPNGKAALNARLEKLINFAPVMLFMKGNPDAPQCGFSNKIVALLKQEGTRYE
jgi:hypothetical protein